MWLALASMCFVFFFFFQAEDGIRDYKVTGVQTCALPISRKADQDNDQADRNHQPDPPENVELERLAFLESVHEIARFAQRLGRQILANQFLHWVFPILARHGLNSCPEEEPSIRNTRWDY